MGFPTEMAMALGPGGRKSGEGVGTFACRFQAAKEPHDAHRHDRALHTLDQQRNPGLERLQFARVGALALREDEHRLPLGQAAQHRLNTILAHAAIDRDGVELADDGPRTGCSKRFLRARNER